MNLVSSKAMLEDAQKNGYAVPAFNFENMEMLVAICQAADKNRSPIILQTTSTTAKFIGLDLAFAMADKVAARFSVPIALNLDHSEDPSQCYQAIRCGFTSVMIDGSKLPLEENIAVTKEVVRVAKAINLPVEAELGKVGGKEDEAGDGSSNLTDPVEAEYFLDETDVDYFAVAIGTAHGLYKAAPDLKFDLLAKIRSLTDKPLVLHGGTGIPREQISKAISHGICKVNFATELRIAATTAARDTLRDQDIIDPKAYMKKAMIAVYDMATEKIQLCKSMGKY